MTNFAMAPSLRSRLGAIAAQRCPVCLEGRMFAGGFRMNEQCPVCGHRFMREPGYFQGAMYVSYALATAVFLIPHGVGNSSWAGGLGSGAPLRPPRPCRCFWCRRCTASRG